LCATSTLSTGINLPAKAVIFKGPMIAKSLMDAAKYKQMSGRAGRTGFDAKGDSIMVCSKEHVAYVQDLTKPFQCKLVSALTGVRLMRALLDIIASGSITSMPDISCYLRNTLKYVLCTRNECLSCCSTID
jgi:DNA polymerase theta